MEPSSELVFVGPHTEIISTKLKLENPSDRYVYFKVKTTAPKHYCVRPNSGVIKPRSASDISVHLQPVDQPSSLERDGAKHKFMIQSAVANDDHQPIDDFWKNANSANVMDSKLRVVFNLTSPPTNVSSDVVGKESPVIETAVPPPKPFKELSTGSDSKETDIRKRFDAEKTKLERDNRDLRDEIARLNRLSQNANVEIGIPTIQVILIAFAMLLVGLILGKMF
ncbi:hypothetical protein FO519_002184 [Halicephalobus sp. NKZ332]|nr:hypothetical protein FO519_002184 [Halicephalobus sp. NKZ332]